MNRVLIHVEGETEETFVNEVLSPHLYACGYVSVSARLLGNARRRDRRGGIQAWAACRKDILRHMQEDPNRCCTIMVDYYALPKTGNKAWPGREEADRCGFKDKADTVEQALLQDLAKEMPHHPTSFIPYVMMHEFEGLLFSDCQRFGAGIGREELVSEFQSIRDQFETPEEINDSPLTAPSKRILNLIPGYQKPLLGSLAALEIGLDAIRSQCPFFNRWLERLESLPGARPSSAGRQFKS